MAYIIVVEGAPDMEDGHREVECLIGPFVDEASALTFAEGNPQAVRECGRGRGCCWEITDLVRPTPDDPDDR